MNLEEMIAWRTVPDRVARLAQAYTPDQIKEAIEKKSFNPLKEIGEAMQFFPGKTFGIPSKPNPLVASLLGGLAGAGLGYGTGYLAEQLQPASWERGRTRRTFAAMGGMLGAAPGLSWALMNVNSGRPFWKGMVDSETVKPLEFGPETDPVSYMRYGSPYLGTPSQPIPKVKMPTPADTFDITRPGTPKIAAAVVEFVTKQAQDFGTSGLFGAPPIDVNEFNRTVWQDPQVAGRLSLQQQAAASGMMTGAANLPGKYSPRFVTPLDMGRMALGMGSGFLSGATVGRALGFLFGMPQESQDRLKQTGVIAGAIANALPIVFGG